MIEFYAHNNWTNNFIAMVLEGKNGDDKTINLYFCWILEYSMTTWSKYKRCFELEMIFCCWL